MDRYVTSTAADGVYLISEGEDRRVIATVKAPKEAALQMAAAPDLFEALAFLVDGEGEPNAVGMHSICVSHQAVLDARAALSKARGDA